MHGLQPGVVRVGLGKWRRLILESPRLFLGLQLGRATLLSRGGTPLPARHDA